MPGAHATPFSRYVALGDSRTEGVGDPRPAGRQAGRPDASAEPRWAAESHGPWVAPRLRGRSSGDGRTAKRPYLTPTVAEPARES